MTLPLWAVCQTGMTEYRKVTMDFVDCCEQNHLQVNASKTREMMVDFPRKSSKIALVNIQGLDIERVRTHKYLGVHFNSNLVRQP